MVVGVLALRHPECQVVPSSLCVMSHSSAGSSCGRGSVLEVKACQAAFMVILLQCDVFVLYRFKCFLVCICVTLQCDLLAYSPLWHMLCSIVDELPGHRQVVSNAGFLMYNLTCFPVLCLLDNI